MGKLVSLILGEGNFEEGFPAILQIGEEGKPIFSQYTGYLPPDPKIPEIYIRWQTRYRRFVGSTFRLEKITAQLTNFSIVETEETAADLSNRLNQWLNSQSFISIREALLKNLKPDERVRFIIQTSNIELQQLPWHLWDFVEGCPQAEIVLSIPNYERVTLPKTSRTSVSILAIMGDNTDINVKYDSEIIASIPNAKTCFLVNPKRQDINQKLWEQPYDIIFFAGHSRTEGEIGRIDINESESLTIAELRDALKNATSQGLQLAIFNSCDGLGLARELAALNIPQIIVMREPVPDKVAQEFLKYFIVAFSSGLSLALAVRKARERLQGLEGIFPCASWLPVVFQNPAVIPLSWKDLGGNSIKPNSIISKNNPIF